MLIYLAGPMTGIRHFNFEAFDDAAVILRARGYDVTSPAEMDDADSRDAALHSETGSAGTGSHEGKTWGDFLARDVKLLADGGIEGIVCLPDWWLSSGAKLETFVANLLNLPIYPYQAHPGMVPVSLVQLPAGWDGRTPFEAWA